VAAVVIGVDPHTAAAIVAAEESLGQVRVRASAAQAERLLAWAAAWPQRTWAVEGAAGLGRVLGGRKGSRRGVLAWGSGVAASWRCSRSLKMTM
jgi:hypothetical protein